MMKLHTHNQSTVTCNNCGHNEPETMPQDACVYLYECRSCRTLMTPQAGDCCIFCSRGSHPCPTSQRESKSYYAMPQTAVQNADSISPVTQSSMAG
ncbi:GDCCVxC domain-containing (seleno)protein [Endozoicomonas sp. OPT23]|uniref:GDCCVxC domain-containing (seleno)protein n=1 Tax=Endozoicomonas sp. OPT23 TaxID=2072845 RepID=UPI001E39146A|nr:GDCCVxC domain-containing (seleno)protein [Endozoicomonas sp. OPT23]